MSSGRKAYDGNVARRYTSISEWGDSVGSEGKINKHAASKRTAGLDEDVAYQESMFNESSDKDRYLITYADLVTLLLGLFIILYAISNIDIEKYKTLISAMGDVFGGKAAIVGLQDKKEVVPTTPIDKLKNEVNELITKYDYQNSIKVEESSRGLIIRILDDILFPTGSANLNTKSKSVLKRIAAIIKNIPNGIRIEGHTDNIPISTSAFPSNWHLSVNRALNTAYYLIDKENVKPEKVSIVGYSKYHPIADNKDGKGRSLNRRVDIVIIKE